MLPNAEEADIWRQQSVLLPKQCLEEKKLKQCDYSRTEMIIAIGMLVRIRGGVPSSHKTISAAQSLAVPGIIFVI
jgi:hypothetical protein